MNRIFKFRVWGTERKKFINLHYNQVTLQCEDGAVYFPGFDSTYTGEYIVQQFTGLKDKNGKEIYEGDIISGTPYFFNYEKQEWKSGEEVLIGNVFYVNFWATYKVDYNHIMYDFTIDLKDVGPSGEIIGNIFENKELLNNE